MSRPKGSKNKKTIIQEAQSGKLIVEEQRNLEKLLLSEKELQAAEIELRTQMKKVKKQIRISRRRLEELKAMHKAFEEAQQKQKNENEVRDLVDYIMNSDVPTEVLLDKMRKAI